MTENNGELNPYQLSQSISKDKVMEHLDKIVDSLGYESNQTERIRTWIELYEENELIHNEWTVDKDHFESRSNPEIGDYIYLFDKDNLLCDSKYRIIDLIKNNVDNTDTIVFKLDKSATFEYVANLSDFLNNDRVTSSLRKFFSRDTEEN